MKILVTGSKSQLATELYQESISYPEWNWQFLSKEELDITEESEVKKCLGNKIYDFIINCAAFTHVENAETQQVLANKVNSEGPKWLSKYAGNAQLIHFSTDFVFSGEQNFPYNEEAIPNPINQYGASKLSGEKAIVESCSRYVILRVSWLYGTHGKNFMKTMIRLADSKPFINVVDDQFGTPTYTGDLVKSVIKIIQQGGLPNDIYHFSNEGSASWYDFAQSILDYADKDVQIIPVPAIEFPSEVIRPKFSVMNKRKIKEALGIEIPHWRESLKNAITKLKDEE